jgi:hypothetical protein
MGKMLTARVSVATAVTTNRRLKVMRNSSAKAWPVLTDGTVTPPDMKGWKTPLRAKEAQMEADTCAAM